MEKIILNKIARITVAALCLFLTSCEYDNYDAPSYTFSGNLICDGENFPYDSNMGLLRVYQSGYGKVDGGGVGIRTDDNGHFQQLFFNADYKMTLVNESLPFELPDFPSLGQGKGYDSLSFHFDSDVSRDFEVRPYYKISNLNAELKNGNIVATFDVTKMTNTVKSAPAIVKTRIWLSTSTLVNSGISCTRSSDVEYLDDNTLQVYIPLSEYRRKEYYVNNFRTYAFYRVAIELEGMNRYFLFSKVGKIENLPVE